MHALAKGVKLAFGLVGCTVTLYNAIEPDKSGNVTICQGPDSENEHPPIKLRYPKVCEKCGEIPQEQVRKAQVVGDEFIPLTDEEIAGARESDLELKKLAGLTPHPAAAVDESTVPGEKLYYLVPEGSADVYAAMRHLVVAHPELAWMLRWTPRSRASQFRLVAFGEVLAFQERVHPDNVRSRPEVDAPDNPALIAMAEQVLALPGMVTDYDPETYADKYGEKIAALVASKTPVAGVTPLVAPSATPVAASDAMAALQAMLNAHKEAA